jgi:hypothetical protein
VRTRDTPDDQQILNRVRGSVTGESELRFYSNADAARNAGDDSVDYYLADWAEDWYTNTVRLIGAWDAFERFPRRQIGCEPNISCDGQKDLIFQIDDVSLRGFEFEN